MHGQCLDAGLFGDRGDAHGVAVRRIPAGADLQGHRDIDGRDHGIENATDQRLVLQQGGPRHEVADLLRRTPHIDVDDLGTLRRVETGGIRHHGRIGAGDLHGNRFVLAGMVDAATRLFTAPDERVGGNHLGDGETGSQRTAELPERTISDACHGGKYQVAGECVRTYSHRICVCSEVFRG